MSTQAAAQSTQSALWALLIDELIDEASSAEVETARKIMETYFGSDHRLERKQMSNLVAVAGETGSVPIVEDFVRYQMGRDERRQTWRAGHPKSLGDMILDHLHELKNVSAAVVDRAKKRAPGLALPNSDEEVRAQVWSLITRRFTAYLEHSYLYHKQTKGARGGSQ